MGQKLPVPGAVLCFVLDKKPGLITREQRKKVPEKGINAVVVNMESSEIVRLTCYRISVHALSS